MKQNVTYPSIWGMMLFCVVILFGEHVNAQANFELAERFTADNMQNRAGSKFLRAIWIEDEDDFWYECEDGDGKRWVYVDAARQSRRPLLNNNKMAAQLSETFNLGFNTIDLDLRVFDYDPDG